MSHPTPRQLWLTFACAAAAALLTAAISIAVIMTPHLPGRSTVTVPAIADSAQLDELAADPHFRLTVDYDYSPAPEGSVISQSPAAGALRRTSNDHPCHLSVTLSLGPRRVELPALTGLDSSSATARLQALGLEVELESVSGPAGQVLASIPKAGTQLSVGSTVRLCIGRDSVTMPDLRGLSEADARRRLERLGLTAARSEYVASSRAAGTVTAQSAAPGSTLPAGSSVILTVSLG